MERLSNIIRTTQQRTPARTGERLPAQRAPQEQTERRFLREQSGQVEPDTRPHYQARPPLSPRTAAPRNEGWERPGSQPARPAGRQTYNNQAVPRYAEQPPQGDYYHEAEANPTFSNDWGDDTAGMGYGDWENTSGYQYASDYEEEREHPSGYPSAGYKKPAYPSEYMPPDSGVRDAGLTPRAPTRELSPAAQRIERLHSRGGPFVTRELQRVSPENPDRPAPSRDSHEGRLPVPASSSQLTPLRQGARVTQRTTQPLKTQQIARLPLEMQQPVVHPQRPLLPETIRGANTSYTIVVGSSSTACTICKGTGFLRSDVPYGHPQFGKAVACECKVQERKRKRRQQLQEISNLGAFLNKRFTTFDPRMAGLREAFEESAAFAKNPSGWLLLIGPNGCGKTHLAAAIANDCLEAGAVVLFATVPDLLDHLRAAFAPDSNEVYDQLFARMREAEVLILDDLGAQQSSPWANEKLFQLLNYRYNSGFPTVLTANPRGYQTTDERIRSRLSDVGLVITLNLDKARDYRPNNPRHR